MNTIPKKAGLLLCLWLTGVLQLNAQINTGSSCTGAVNTGVPQQLTQPDTEGWISFQATSTNLNLYMERNSVSDPVAIQGMTVYSGACSALTAIGSNQLSGSTDPQLFVPLNGLSVGTTYYVKTSKINFTTNCTNCSTDRPQATFNSSNFPCNLTVTLFQDIDLAGLGGSLPVMGTYFSPSTNPFLQLPPLCGNHILQIAYNQGAVTQVWLTNGVTTSSYSAGASVFTLAIPANTTTTAQQYTLITSPYYQPILDPEFGCKTITFDVLPLPDVNFGIQPNPVCQGSPFCLISPPASSLATVVYDYYKITGAWAASPSFSYNATNWYGNPGNSVIITNSITAANVITSTCLATNSYSVGQHPFGLVAYYTFSNWPGYNGCVHTSVKNLSVSPNPGTISISSSTSTVCKGTSLTLTATINPAITSVTWQPGNLTGLVVSVTPSVSTTYTLIASTAAGCTVSATLFIEAKDCCVPELPSMIALTNCTLVANGTGGATPWANIVSGANLTGVNIALPAGGAIAGNFFIKGNLSVNAAATLQNSRMVFDEAAAIIQNAALTVNKSYLSGCNKNWVGIRTGAILTVSNSVIEDAQDAVISNVGSGVHGGITLYNTIFNKNYRGVNIGFRPYALLSVKECIFTTRIISPSLYAYQSGTLWRNLTAFSPATLQTYLNANLMGSPALGLSNAGRGQIGIQLFAASSSQSGNPPLNIGANLSQPYVNLFDNLPVGIYNYGSNITVLKNQFMNHSGISGYDATAGQSAGVYVDQGRVLVGTITGAVGSVASNTFVSNKNGVMATNNSSVQIGGNQFSGHSQSGVFITKMYSSAGNTFVNTVVNNAFLNNGIDVNGFDNQKIQLQVMSNTSQHTPAAFKNNQAYNVVLAELNQNAACQYSVESNVFNGKFTNGVLAMQVYGASVSNNTITMKPPFSSNFMAPVWLQNSAEMKVKSNVLNASPSTSQSWNTFGIFTALCTNNLYCSNDIKGTGTSMKFQGNSPSMIWKNKLNNNPSDPNQIGIFLDANGFVGNINFPVGSFTTCAENEFGDFGYADTYVGSGNGNLIDYPLPNSAGNPYCPFVNLSGSSSSPNFTATANGNLGYADCGGPTLQQINSLSSTTTALSTGIAPIVNNASSNVSSTPEADYIADKGVYTLIRQSAVNPAAVNGGVAFVNTLSQSAIGTFYKTDSLASKYAVNHNTLTLQQAQTQNAITVTGNTIDQNQKLFNGIYLTYLKDENQLTSAQMSSLRQLAALCPFTDGTSVYQARTLLRKYDSTQYVNECERSVPPAKGAAGRTMGTPSVKTVTLTTQVFPNPASTELNITTELENAEFTLYNVLGEVLISTKLNPLTKLDVSGLKNASYLYTIRQSGQLIQSDKLIITK